MESESVKVLAIDDNRDNLTALRAVLRDALPGCVLVTADSGEKGLDLARAEDPDVILLDIVMPGMDGIEVCRVLKADERLQATPVLVLTALRSDRETRVKALEAGAEGFLTKPWEEPELIAQIRAMAKIKTANRLLRFEREELAGLVAERTRELEQELAERWRVEGALRESEVRYRTLLENSPDAIMLTIPDGAILSANPAACRMFGRTEAEICALGRAGLVDESDPRLAKLIEERARTGRATGEMTFVRKDGTSFPGEASSVLFKDNSGAMRSSTIIRDVTERTRDAAERVRLTVAIEQAAETVMVTDAAGAIQYVNPAFERMAGYTRSDVIGRNPRFLKSGRQDVAFYRELWETIASGRVWKGRLTNRRKDGSLYNEETTISPVHDEAGRIVNYVAVKRDVTEQLRLSEERSRLEDQLRQAQKVEAIGRLAGGVAHDFNNLTAIVIGYGEMLLRQLPAQDPRHKWAEQIVEAGGRSAALTRQLLAFSRKQVLQPEVLDLNALLRNIEKMLGRLIGEDVDLRFSLGANLGRVKADPGQLEQVVINLMVNARDAMPDGGSLTIETADVDLDDSYVLSHEFVGPGTYVMLAITDTGCGMDKATLAKLFEPFFTTKPRGQGTGLGLATVYGIVKQSGGHILAYSEPGRGTTFKVYLPRTEDEQFPQSVESGVATPGGAGERILLVEDELPLLQLCEATLARLGHHVWAAASGAQALLVVEEQRCKPDLIVTDVIMPGMSGAELAERLRRSLPCLKVLYMSGYPDDAIARYGVLDPGTPFIQKPFTERSLAVKVREALAGEFIAGGSGKRVLMIDDDDQYCELVRHFCAKRNHVFTGVTSAAAALEALAVQRFDVLLVDLNLPGTNGERILREVREAGCVAPAIVLTGDVTSADLDALRPLGAMRAVEKSSRPDLLLQAIDETGTNDVPGVGPKGRSRL